MTINETAPDNDDATREPLLLDPEALLLCAMMWAPDNDDDATRVCTVLTAKDFYKPQMGALFSIITTRRTNGEAADPASIQSWLSEQGDRAPLPAHTARPLLIDIATLGVTHERIIAFADQVLGASYRRGYQVMATALAHAGETAPEDQLFEIMVNHGRAQRTAWNRRHALKTTSEDTQDD
jgi:Replicative DNA helicase